MAIAFGSGSPYHHSYETEGNESISDRFHWTSHSVGPVTYNDGKADAFKKVKEGLDVDALEKKANGWNNVHDHVNGVWQKLNAAYDKLFVGDTWTGDDATKAAKTFRDTTDSASNIAEYSGNMHQGTSTIAKAAAAAKGQSSDGPSGLAQYANVETLGLAGFNGDGDAAEQAYFTLVGKINDGRSQMPNQLEWQAKPGDGAGSTIPPIGQQGGNVGSGGGGVSGVTAPHTGTAAPAHTSVSTTGLKHPPNQVDPTITDTQDPVKDYQVPEDTSGTYTGTNGLDNGDYGTGTSGVGAGVGGAGLGHGGSGVGLDTGSSLAGVGSGAGGGSGLGGGVGGGAGAGLGGGAGSGLGGASGAGLGAGGLAGDGSGAAGAGAAGAGANGRGGVGGQVAPMRGGGGGGGDESERERSTWLQEDDDVWGETDAPPSVIS